MFYFAENTPVQSMLVIMKKKNSREYISRMSSSPCYFSSSGLY